MSRIALVVAPLKRDPTSTDLLKVIPTNLTFEIGDDSTTSM